MDAGGTSISEPCALHELAFCSICKAKKATPPPAGKPLFKRATDPDIGSIFAAAFGGFCGECEHHIYEGDPIRAYGDTYVHADCV